MCGGSLSQNRRPCHRSISNPGYVSRRRAATPVGATVPRLRNPPTPLAYAPRMKRSWFAVALFVSLVEFAGSGCGKDAEQQAREDVDREMAARGEKKPSEAADTPTPSP